MDRSSGVAAGTHESWKEGDLADLAVGEKGKGRVILFKRWTELLRGTTVNRTCRTHKNLYIQPFLLTIFGPINYGPP